MVKRTAKGFMFQNIYSIYFEFCIFFMMSPKMKYYLYFKPKVKCIKQ